MSDQSGDSFPKGIQLTPFDPNFRDHPYEVLKLLREKAPVLHDHHRDINFARQHRTIANTEDWRRIEEDQIIEPLRLGN